MPRRPDLQTLTDRKLLALRFKDLHLQIDGTRISRRVLQLYSELEGRGIRFRPPVWLSDEWFSPDSTPGIAIPFYLAHPRLLRLQTRQMLYAEGATDAECLRILRHEAGHAICTAYQLQRRRLCHDTFGPYGAPYPESYRPNPASREFVHHLHAWYAQAHPVEDFAETFAVWLTPGSRWRTKYEGWGARAKLEAMQELMDRYVIGHPAKVRRRTPVDELDRLPQTLEDHYTRRRLSLVEERPTVSDRTLRDLFSAAPRFRRQPSAAQFIQQRRRLLRQRLSRWSGVAPYTVNQLLSDVVQRCKALRLRLTLSEAETEDELGVLLTVQTMNFLHSGHVRIAM